MKFLQKWSCPYLTLSSHRSRLYIYILRIGGAPLRCDGEVCGYPEGDAAIKRKAGSHEPVFQFEIWYSAELADIVGDQRMTAG